VLGISSVFSPFLSLSGGKSSKHFSSPKQERSCLSNTLKQSYCKDNSAYQDRTTQNSLQHNKNQMPRCHDFHCSGGWYLTCPPKNECFETIVENLLDTVVVVKRKRMEQTPHVTPWPGGVQYDA
jgi:hypothetical protein